MKAYIIVLAMVILLVPLSLALVSEKREIADKDVVQLIEELKSEDHATKLSAKNQLMEMGGQITPYIINALKNHDNPFVRSELIEILAEVGDRSAYTTLLNLLNKQEQDKYLPKGLVLIGIGRTGGIDALPLLIEEAKSNDPLTRRSAILGLGETKSRSALPYLIPLLDEKDKPIEEDALTAIGKIGDPAVTPFLIKHLENADGIMRTYYAVTLSVLTGVGEGRYDVSIWNKWWEEHKDEFEPLECQN